MRIFALILMCALLFAAAACGRSSSESNGEISSEEDVRSFFETIMPDLVDAFTELANQQSVAVSGLASNKGGGNSSTAQCPDGGALIVDLATGQASLTDCSVRGVTISASLALFVYPITPSSFEATFNGILMVSGSFNGTIQVNQAYVQWTDPASPTTTYWQVTVTVDEQTFIASSVD